MSYAIVILIVSLLLIAVGFIWMFMYLRDIIKSIELKIHYIDENLRSVDGNVIDNGCKINLINSRTISVDDKVDVLLQSMNTVNNYTKFVAECTARNNRKVKHKKNKEQ